MPDAASGLLLILMIAGLTTAYAYRRRIRALLSRLRDADNRARKSEKLGLILYQQSRPQAKFAAREGAAPFAGGTWQKIGGDGLGWEGGVFYKVRGLACQGDNLFASLTGPKSDGPRGEVWRWDGLHWSLVGGGANGPWTGDTSFVDHLAAYGDRIYAACAQGIWRFDDDYWEDVTHGLPVSSKCSGYAFCEWRGKLTVGCWGNPMVAQFDGADWMEIAPPPAGWGSNVRTIYCLADFKEVLYAGTGTGKFTGPSSAVWRYDGTHWEQIAGGGIRGSWMQDGIPFVLSLTVFQDRLVATLSRPPDSPAPLSNVWAFDGETWMPVLFGRTPDLMARSLIMNDAIVYDDQFIVATGDGQHRHAQIWAMEANSRWNAIGGDAFRSPENGHDGGYWIYRLCADNSGRLYAGTAGHRGAARVFAFQPASTKSMAD